MTNFTLKIKQFGKAKNYPIPKRAREGDVGYDMFCTQGVLLKPMECANVATDIALEMPDGVWVQIVPRSSSNFKRLLVYNGTIDTGYRGKLWILVQNLSNEDIMINEGDRIAQFIPHLTVQTPPELELTDVLMETERGTDGFGSTGDAISNINPNHQ